MNHFLKCLRSMTIEVADMSKLNLDFLDVIKDLIYSLNKVTLDYGIQII